MPTISVEVLLRMLQSVGFPLDWIKDLKTRYGSVGSLVRRDDVAPEAADPAATVRATHRVRL